MTVEQDRWPVRKARVLIVQEVQQPAPWMKDVGIFCDTHEGAHLDSAGLDVVVLHGRAAWVETWLRTSQCRFGEFGLLIVLADWSSVVAAALLRQSADDVVTGAVEGPELGARLHAILRRVRQVKCTDHGVPIELREAERKLLEYLRACPGRVVTQSELLDNVFGGIHRSGTSLVRVHVSRLRRRLGGVARLRTVRGSGYVLEYES